VDIRKLLIPLFFLLIATVALGSSVSSDSSKQRKQFFIRIPLCQSFVADQKASFEFDLNSSRTLELTIGRRTWDTFNSKNSIFEPTSLMDLYGGTATETAKGVLFKANLKYFYSHLVSY